MSRLLEFSKEEVDVLIDALMCRDNEGYGNSDETWRLIYRLESTKVELPSGID